MNAMYFAELFSFLHLDLDHNIIEQNYDPINKIFKYCYQCNDLIFKKLSVCKYVKLSTAFFNILVSFVKFCKRNSCYDGISHVIFRQIINNREYLKFKLFFYLQHLQPPRGHVVHYSNEERFCSFCHDDKRLTAEKYRKYANELYGCSTQWKLFYS